MCTPGDPNPSTHNLAFEYTLKRKQDKEMIMSLPLPDPPKDFSFEKTLADSLLDLTYDHRREIDEEIHGATCRAVEETTKLVETSLAEFDAKLNKKKTQDAHRRLLRNVVRISPTKTNTGDDISPNTDQVDASESSSSASHGSAKPARATSSSPVSSSVSSSCYLNDPDVRLRFLRCDRFHVDKAVQRLIDFLAFMVELFGDFVCERPVCITDFNGRELTALANSRNQILPFRDRSGRCVLAGVGNCNFQLDEVLRYKIFMYLNWVASCDVETQKKGIVIVGWFFDEPNDQTWEKDVRPSMTSNLPVYHQKQNKGLPVRVVSWQHYYRDTAYFRFLAGLYVFSVDSTYRSAYKVHFGEQTELQYKLATYGVPVDLLPASYTGTLKLSNHSSWLNAIRTQMNPPPELQGREIVLLPNSTDVVFRKGITTRNNPGNMHYRELLDYYSLEHFRGGSKQKYDITKLIMETIEQRQGRFLEWLHKRNLWVVCDDRDKIRLKIAAAFKQYNRSKGRHMQKLAKTIQNAMVIGNDDVLDQSNRSGKTPPEDSKAASSAAADSSTSSAEIPSSVGALAPSSSVREDSKINFNEISRVRGGGGDVSMDLDFPGGVEFPDTALSDYYAKEFPSSSECDFLLCSHEDPFTGSTNRKFPSVDDACFGKLFFPTEAS